MYNFFEKLACNFLIWRFRVGYGPGCGEYEGSSVSCKAAETRKFLKEHVELIDFFS